MKHTGLILKAVSASLFALTALATHSITIAGNGPGEPGGSGNTSLDPKFDTSYAIEYSYSCLSGCHENDTQLVEEHAGSFMTHAMVKCNACHGTHTVDTVGQEKPNLTGYYPGINHGEYRVGDDRCIACHTPTLDNPDHPNKTWDCISCHTPHMFPS